MQISYASKMVEECFEDWRIMQRKISPDWVRTIKKHVLRFKAANTFGVFLQLNLGHPEPLKGAPEGRYSVRVSGNVRLIFMPICKGKDIRECEEIKILGVEDYHGCKKTRYIP